MENKRTIDRITELLFVIKDLTHAHHKKQSHLSLIRLVVLRHIRTRQPVTMKELAAYLQVTLPSASSIISDLERLRYVKRQVSMKDRRVAQITLTSHGEKAMRTETDVMEQRIENILHNLSRADKESLYAIMHKLYKYSLRLNNK